MLRNAALYLLLSAALVLVWPAQAQAAKAREPRAQVQASLTPQTPQPGQPAVLTITVNIKAGFHAQSNRPLDENLIPFEVKLKEEPALISQAPQYPPGEIHEYPQLGKLSVYTGTVTVKVPVTIKADAQTPAKLAGTVRYQICDDKTCYAPENTPFEVAIPGAAPPPVAAQPAARAPIIGSLFGWRFELDPNSVLLPLLVAFLAGIIFNVMPCVLPVLPLKAISFYEVAQHNRAKSVLLSLVFGLGIVATFAVLGLFVLVLRSFSWGELFARGWFIWTIVGILMVLAAGMFGGFSMQLPTAVYSVAPRHDTYTGNFLFGILAAVLSTPCTAPMFPPALVWASLQPAYLGMGAMLAAGLGMAFPYILLSAFPEVARRFPRTGPFAELVKQMMGFLLLGAAAYFAGSRLIGGGGLWWLVFAVVVWAAVYLVIRTPQLTGRPGALLVVTALAVAMTGGSLWFVLGMTGTSLGAGKDQAAAEAGKVPWLPYSAEALETTRKEGKVALVKFTADWCGNCQYVEATVFRDPRTLEAIHQRQIVPLKADLTLDTAPGWPLLRQLSPAGGIPLTAIYAPGIEQPLMLASVYTTQSLLDTLDQLPKPAPMVEAR